MKLGGRKMPALRRMPTRVIVVLGVVFASSVVSWAKGGDLVADVLSSFGKSADDERYLILVDVGFDRGRFAATLAVTQIGAEIRLSREVITSGDRLPGELLPAKTSAAFLNELRSFDWSAQPKKAEPQIGCVFGRQTRITLQARVHGTFRENSGDATRSVALAHLIEMIAHRPEETNPPS